MVVFFRFHGLDEGKVYSKSPTFHWTSVASGEDFRPGLDRGRDVLLGEIGSGRLGPRGLGEKKNGGVEGGKAWVNPRIIWDIVGYC